MKHSDYIRYIEDSDQVRNATVIFDDDGLSRDRYRIITCWEEWTGTVWAERYDLDEFFSREEALEYGEERVRSLEGKEL